MASVKGRALIVEDDADTAELLRLHLEQLGFSVVTASDRDTALGLLHQLPVALVLLDRHLGARDALSLLRELRRDAVLRDLPVLMISGRSERAAIAAAYAAGADGYVTKPFSAGDVASGVEAALGARR